MKMNNKKAGRFIKIAVSVILALVMGFIAAAGYFNAAVRAEQTAERYLSQVRVYTAQSEAQARALCEADGFIPVEGNLNEGSGYDAVILGYKTTDDADEALTDVRMMQMTSGFSSLNYSEVISRQYPKLDGMIQNELTAAREFAVRLNSGSSNAAVARDYLNLFTIPETGMKLGDYLSSDSVNADTLKKLFLQSATAVTTTIMTQLTLGVSEYGEDNWAARVSQNKDILDADSYDELDRKYLDSSESLVTAIQDFATKYLNAMARAEANGGKIVQVSSDTASAETMNEQGADSMYVLAHDMLNQYSYDEEKKLGDWLVELGCLKFADKTEIRLLYPLTVAMTAGQIIMAGFTGINSLALYLNDISSNQGDLTGSLEEAKSTIRQTVGGDAISVWAGVDQDLFSRTVAVTGDAQRYTNIKNTADNMIQRSRTIEALDQITSIAQKAVTIAGGVAALLTIPATIVEAFVADAALWYCQHFTTYMVFACLGKAASVIASISKIAIVVILIIMLIVWLYDTFKPECDDLTYTDIPEIAMNLSKEDNTTRSSGLLRYDLIQSPDNKADINAYNGKQWNALYASSNRDAGNPIVVPEGKAAFIVQTGSSSTPEGYAPVKNFDEIYAANLNANTRSSEAPQIYLFYSSPGNSEEAVVAPEDDVPVPSETPAAEQKQYIASLYLSNADSETKAKLTLTNKGYQTIDANLTPSVGSTNFFGKETNKSYTYLGFTVTANPDTAVTDIRVAKLKSTNQAVLYGTMKYTAAGYDAHGNSICYTLDKNAGSPITAESLQVLDKMSDAPAGSEFVSYLAGPAYNFDSSSEDTKWDSSKYICFKPSVSNISEEEYISGLFFVAGRDADESGYSLTDYVERLGGKLLGSTDLTKGKVWNERIVGLNYVTVSEIRDYRTYLCYTTTHDPKRAVYDVQYYIGATKMNYMMPTLTAVTGTDVSNTAQTGYAVSSVFIQNLNSPINQSGTYSKSELIRYEDNIYNDFLASYGYTLDFYGQRVDNVLPGVSWSSVKSQPRALYASGYKTGCQPLKVTDLVMTSGNAPEGYASVRDIKYPYDTNLINMAYYSSEKAAGCNVAYLYINRKAPVKGKYISDIYLSTYITSSGWSEAELTANNAMADDLCYINLLSAASGGILNTNLAAYSSRTWYNAKDEDGYGAYDYPAQAAYLGVSYTNDPGKAIHGIIRKRVTDSAAPTDTLKVGGATYTLVKNISSSQAVPITAPNGQQYYLYTSTSTGASPAAAPITDIVIDENVFDSGLATVLSVDRGDIPKQTDRLGNTIQEEQLIAPFGDTNECQYIHVNTDANLLGIDSFYVGTGSSAKAAMSDLLSQGATNCLPLNLNDGTSYDFVYIGYSKYNPDYTKTRRTKYYMELAIKDLYIYAGKDPAKTMTVSGRKYKLCSTKSLNEGGIGTGLYLYQTTDIINDKDKTEASYITGISAAKYDRVPEDIAENRWENLLSTDNLKINLNEGNLGFDSTEGRHLIDNRIYAFIHRNDNYVKPEAAITGGYTTDVTRFSDIVLSKN